MKTNNLILLGGGFIAGYVLCKLMNRNSESMSFSLSGEDDTISGGRDNTKYRYSGKGVALIGRQNNVNFRRADLNYLVGQNVISTANLYQPFTIIGKTKKLAPSNDPNLINAGVYVVSNSANGIEYVKTSLFWKIGQNNTEIYPVWLPKESVVRI